MPLLTRKKTNTKQTTPNDKTTVGQKLSRAKTAVGPWGNEGTAATKAFLAVFLLAALAGPLALAFQLGRPTDVTAPAPTTTASTDPTLTGAQQRATGTAVDFMTLWMSASADDTDLVAAHLMYPPQTIALPQKPPTEVPGLAVIGANEATAGIWQVLVSARTTTQAQTWQVEVAVTNHTATVVALPGPVPTSAPEAGHIGEVDTLATTHPAAQTAAGFVDAFLTGRGDVSRWTSPDATLTAIIPAVCGKTTSSVTAPLDPTPTPQTGDVLNVVVTTDCTANTAATEQDTTGKDATEKETDNNGRGAGSTFSYGLELRGRDGRWEVANLIPVDHVLRTQQPQTPPPASTPPQSPEAPTPSATNTNEGN